MNQPYLNHLTLITITSASILLQSQVFAGGYLARGTSTGNPALWDDTTPVVVNLDLGGLGSLSNAQADALVLDALNTWSNSELPSCALSFSIGTDLNSDHAGTSIPQWDVDGDGITPIIYDTDGSVTDFLLGAGASTGVLGFAGPEDFSGLEITEGHSVLNGLFINGTSGPSDPSDVSISQFTGVIAHELGHMLNLDHAQFNTAQALHPGHDPINFNGFPTMYPQVHPDIETLAKDDIAWISFLYPAIGYESTVSSFGGSIRNSSNILLNAVNVVARNIDNPDSDVISCVSGFNEGNSVDNGEFLIPGLTPGECYVVDIEQISSGFVAGSSVGPFEPQLEFETTGPVEFLNSSPTESNSDTEARSETFVAPAGGNSLTIDGRLNGSMTTSTIAEVDNGSSLSLFEVTDISNNVIANLGGRLRINGTINDSEVGEINFGSGDVEDIIAIRPTFAVEVFDIEVTYQGLQGDVVVGSWDQGNTNGISGRGAFNLASGQTFSFDTPINNFLYGNGIADNTILIMLGADSGQSGTYTVEIMASYADQPNGSAVYVKGIDGDFDPESGTVTILGNGFNNAGADPTVEFSDPLISVDSVSVVNSTELTVQVSTLNGYTGGETSVTVTNDISNGGFSGVRTGLIPTTPNTENWFVY